MKQILIYLILLNLFTWSYATQTFAETEVVPQALPVIQLLEAVKEQDEEKLKSAFSERMQERLKKEEWSKVLERYRDGFNTSFGNFRIEDFSFDFSGDDKNGSVIVSYNGKPLPNMSVLKESDGWKLNEQ